MPSITFEAWSGLSDESIREKFEQFDKNKSGALDLDEIFDALRELGKTEAEGMKLLESFPEDARLEFDDFKRLVKPEDGIWI